MSAIVRLTVFAACMILLSGHADAHSRSESYSHWHVSGNSVTGTVTIPLREVMLLFQIAEATVSPRELFHDHFVDTVSVLAGGAPCELTSSNVLQAASGFVRVETSHDCGDAPPDTLTFRAMYEVAPSHVNYAKWHVGGRQVGERLFTDSADTWSIEATQAGAGQSFLSFLRVGVEHIAGGIDHIAFLIGLLLIAGTLGRTIIAVTGFTLGHSLSLAAAVLGYVHADGRLVEAFIGFTVALVAVEYFLVRRRNVLNIALVCLGVAWGTGIAAVWLGYLPARALFAYGGFGLFAACYLMLSAQSEAHGGSRATLLLFVATTCFGLVHGFGFAGFLMDTGLLGTSLLVPLLGFNLGVEVGQLMLVAAAMLGGLLLRRVTPASLAPVAAAGLCGIGIFWFVSRTIG